MSEQGTQFQSSAKFGSYAKVWWETNLILVFTLGIMLPWSILKRRMYFYQSVKLDGNAFAFTARPKSVFIGVWVGIILWVLINLLYEYIPLPHDTLTEVLLSSLVFYVFCCPLFAYFADQALTFRRYYSNYCGINFLFDRSYSEALRCMLGFFVVSPMTLFIAYPYFKWRFSRFRFSRTSFGGVGFSFDAKPQAFFRIYFRFFFIAVLPFMILVSPFMLLEWIWEDYAFQLVLILAERYDFGFDWMSSIYFVLAALAFLGVPMFLGVTYLDVNITNLNWRALSVDRVSFYSDARFGQLLWIRLTNMFAILISFGILIPWAKVRVLRYWTQTKSYHGDIQRLTLKAKAQDTINALGEGVSEIAGLDIGI